MSRAATFGFIANAIGVSAALAAGGGAHTGGSTTHYIYVPIYSYPYAALTPQGVPARMPLEMTDAPVRNAESEISIGGVIAAHTLRARAARVLSAPTGDDRGALPAGAVFAEMSTTVTGLSLWCQVEARHGWLPSTAHDCLAARDGRFVQRWIVDSYDNLLMSDTAVARAGAMLAAPVAYRDATPDERNVGLVGFKWCEDDGVAAPPRFGLTIADLTGLKWSAVVTAGCRFGTWPEPADHSQVDIDGLKATVTPGAANGQLEVRVTGHFPPGAELPPLPLARLDLGALVSGGSASLPAVSVNALATTLAATGPPTLAASGEIVSGQVFLSVPVRHALTGRLRNAVKIHDTFEPSLLPVDQPLFGLPTQGKGGQEVIWCAPRQSMTDTTKAALRWRTTCLAERQGAEAAIDIPTAMMATSLTWSRAREASPIDVRPEPVELPPMILQYVFIGFTDPGLPTRFARVELRLDWGDGAQAVRSMSAPVDADGVARFRLLGGVVTFRPAAHSDPRGASRKSADHASFAVLAEPKAIAPF